MGKSNGAFRLGRRIGHCALHSGNFRRAGGNGFRLIHSLSDDILRGRNVGIGVIITTSLGAFGISAAADGKLRAISICNGRAVSTTGRRLRCVLSDLIRGNILARTTR